MGAPSPLDPPRSAPRSPHQPLREPIPARWLCQCPDYHQSRSHACPATRGPWHSLSCRSDRDLLLHCSLFSLREPGASVAVRGGASNATTILRQSRRPSAIHRAHPIPSLTPRQTPVGPAKTTAGAMISPEEASRRGRPRSCVTLCGSSTSRQRSPVPRITGVVQSRLPPLDRPRSCRTMHGRHANGRSGSPR